MEARDTVCVVWGHLFVRLYVTVKWSPWIHSIIFYSFFLKQIIDFIDPNGFDGSLVSDYCLESCFKKSL